MPRVDGRDAACGERRRHLVAGVSWITFVSTGIQISPVVGIENSPPRLKAPGFSRAF